MGTQQFRTNLVVAITAIIASAGSLAAGDTARAASQLNATTNGSPPIRVVVLDETRTNFCGIAWDTNFLTGNVFSDARSALLNPSFFGPAGIVNRSIDLTAVSELSGPALEDADAVFLSSLSADALLNECERQQLQAFVDQGGGLFVFENGAPNRYAELFGGSGQLSGGGSTVTFLPDTVNQGPFGNTEGQSMVFNFHNAFDDLGLHGRAIATDAPNSVVAAAFDYGLGSAIMIADEEWISSYNSPNNCGGATQNAILAQTVFLNAVAYIAPDAGFAYQAIDTNCCAADLNSDGMLNFFDVSVFLTAYSNQDPIADFNDDNTWDFFDVSAFLTAFNAGCP